MILGDMIVDEIEKIDYDILLPTDKDPSSCQVDIRKWTMMAYSKAIYTFTVNAWKTNFVANGGFTNNTNYLASPPFNPIYTPTVAVSLTTESPKFKSQKELYDILEPYFNTVKDYEDTFIDLFQRIFIDWLGVLEVGCGQDSNIPLPIIPPTTLNVAPPFFHSLDGGTLSQFQYPDTDYPKYPHNIDSSTFGVDGSFIPDTNTIAQFDSRINELNLILIKIDNRLEVDFDGEINETEIVERDAYVYYWWERPIEVKEIQKSNSKLLGDEEYKRITGNPFDQATIDYLNSQNATLGTQVSEEYDRMLEEVTTIDGTNWVINTRGSSEARKIAITNERDDMVRKKMDYLNGVRPEIVAPRPPQKVTIGGLNEHAPDMSNTRVFEPKPLHWLYPTQSTFPTIQVPIFFTFPTCVENARLCAFDVMAQSDKAKSDLGIVNRIIGNWIVITLNQAVPTVGGVSGYCYGSPINPWFGSVVGTLTWSES